MLLLVSASSMSGCSSDPTSDDFKRFAEGYAQKAGGEVKLTNGVMSKVTCKVADIDLKKTDSLTNPYQGTATFDVDIANVFIYQPYFPGGKTEAIYHDRVILDFAWNGKEWVHKGGTARITSVSLPAIPKEQRSEYDDFHGGTVAEVTAEKSQSMNILFLNGNINPK
jgi:hypothetical protein